MIKTCHAFSEIYEFNLVYLVQPHDITDLDYSDHFRIIVMARKFQNLKLFGFWWFSNQESIIKNILNSFSVDY